MKVLGLKEEKKKKKTETLQFATTPAIAYLTGFENEVSCLLTEYVKETYVYGRKVFDYHS